MGTRRERGARRHKIAPGGQAFDRRTVDQVGWLMLNQVGLLLDQAGELAQFDCSRRDAAYSYASVLHHQVRRSGFKQSRGHLQGFLASGLGSEEHGRARYLRGAAAEGTKAKGWQGCIIHANFYLSDWQVKYTRCDLRERGEVSLAIGGDAALHQDGPVLANTNGGSLLRYARPIWTHSTARYFDKGGQANAQ